jgi:hypothetical protein
VQLAAAILARRQAEERAGRPKGERDELDARLLAALSLQDNTEGRARGRARGAGGGRGRGGVAVGAAGAALSARELSEGNLPRPEAPGGGAGRTEASQAQVEERLAQAILARDAARRSVRRRRPGSPPWEGQGRRRRSGRRRPRRGPDGRGALAQEIGPREVGEGELAGYSGDAGGTCRRSSPRLSCGARRPRSRRRGAAGGRGEAELRERLGGALGYR